MFTLVVLSYIKVILSGFGVRRDGYSDLIRSDQITSDRRGEIDRHQFESRPRQLQRNWINKFQVVGLRKCAPGVFFRREVEIHDSAMLRQIEPALPSPDLLELLFGELAFPKQKVARFFLICVGGLRHVRD